MSANAKLKEAALRAWTALTKALRFCDKQCATSLGRYLYKWRKEIAEGNLRESQLIRAVHFKRTVALLTSFRTWLALMSGIGSGGIPASSRLDAYLLEKVRMGWFCSLVRGGTSISCVFSALDAGEEAGARAGGALDAMYANVPADSYNHDRLPSVARMCGRVAPRLASYLEVPFLLNAYS